MIYAIMIWLCKQNIMGLKWNVKIQFEYQEI